VPRPGPTSHNVRHHVLVAKVAQRVSDPDILHVLKLILKASGKQGVPQGGVISPLLSNRYLTEVDRMLERAKETTRRGPYTYLEYARFADDLGILVDAYPQHDWLLRAVEKRLREELAVLHVTINEAKSRLVDLTKGESFGFLGCEFRRIRSRTGKWRAYYPPLLKKRTALLRKLKDIFRRHQSQPIDRVIYLITPIVRGWVRYFAIGDTSRCFGFINSVAERSFPLVNWVEMLGQPRAQGLLPGRSPWQTQRDNVQGLQDVKGASSVDKNGRALGP